MPIEEALRYWDYAHDSGGGSHPDAAAPYVGLVSELIRTEGVRSVVDLGCGDFQVGRLIDYGMARVVGVDASSHHIGRLSEELAADPRFSFVHADVGDFDASGFDLGLCKDVLQHWPTDRILRFLSGPLPRLLLLTNDAAGGDINGDIPLIPMRDGRLQVAVRGLDLNAPPFSVGGTVLLRYSGKDCLLLRRPSVRGQAE